MLGLWPYYTIPGAIAIGVFIVVFALSRYISLGSIVSAWAFPAIYLFIGIRKHWPVFGEQMPLLIFAMLIALLIAYTHRTNIQRLRDGTENKFK